MGHRIGCTKVSTAGQSLKVQLEKLGACDKIFAERASAPSTAGRLEVICPNRSRLHAG